MGKGFGAVATAVKDIENRKNSGGGSFTKRRYFVIKDGETAVVRFLEQGDDVRSGWFHKTKPTDKFKYGRFIPCRDQDPETSQRIGEDCPGCESNDKEVTKRKYRGVFNVIWRNAPVFETDEEGKVNWNKQIGNEDVVAVWEVGSELLDDLAYVDGKYKGLGSRDFEITRRGSGLDTKYSIGPADPDSGVVPMSKEDLALSDTKYDLNEIVEPPSYENWGTSGSAPTEVTLRSDTDASPFARRRG